jgi:molybdopterin converting factor small subunit
MKVRLVISGRSYDAAETIPDELSLPDGASVSEAIDELAGHFSEGRSLPRSCLLAVSGKHLGTLASHAEHVLQDGDELVLIVPVAGG